ncbi:MAG: tRNA (adenosine(37)-N6)-threonylcarbamoyltransferase complex transferase subunit TsaD [Betaproteobacteria bacterium]|nr:tRNA (adenosine(37)-N6)-threonylcarbamoyltransferase complex transferase subunit TsaD [Betaproteobacteria bacterium]
MLVLGIETSCDETGIALYHTDRGLIGQALHSQVDLHAVYGGVVPEMASRDHVRRIIPLIRNALTEANANLSDLSAIAYTAGPGLAGALLVGASVASAMAMGLGVPAIPIHHLEGHLLSPMLSATPPTFPFVALLVSGGHTQLMRVTQIGTYELLGETLDDAAGEAFDKAAQMLGFGYPGGPALSALASGGTPGQFTLPRPMMKSANLDFSFAGLKTAVLTRIGDRTLSASEKADLAAEFEQAVVEILVGKSRAALAKTGIRDLVVAGGVGANRPLRKALDQAGTEGRFNVHYPTLELCTDNGAMIAYTGARRLAQGLPFRNALAFEVRPRWDLASITT